MIQRLFMAFYFLCFHPNVLKVTNFFTQYNTIQHLIHSASLLVSTLTL